MPVRTMPSTSQKRNDEFSWSLMRLVRPTGTTKNRPTASATATSTVPAHMPPEIGSSSSGSCALAEMFSALKPMPSDSPSATTPRMIGSRSSRCFFSTLVSGCETSSISPWAPLSGSTPSSEFSSGSGLRTATAHEETPRIITPSRTACPPTGASRCAQSCPSWGAVAVSAIGGCWLARGALGSAALEPLDAATGVDQLLATRVERVALGADLHVDLGLGRACRELVPARAAHVGFDVFRVDRGLHSSIQSSDAVHPAVHASLRAQAP